MADYGGKDPLGTRIDKHFEHLKGKRSTWERHWQRTGRICVTPSL